MCVTRLEAESLCRIWHCWKGKSPAAQACSVRSGCRGEHDISRCSALRDALVPAEMFWDVTSGVDGGGGGGGGGKVDGGGGGGGGWQRKAWTRARVQGRRRERKLWRAVAAAAKRLEEVSGAGCWDEMREESLTATEE